MGPGGHQGSSPEESHRGHLGEAGQGNTSLHAAAPSGTFSVPGGHERFTKPHKGVAQEVMTAGRKDPGNKLSPEQPSLLFQSLAAARELRGFEQSVGSGEAGASVLRGAGCGRGRGRAAPGARNKEHCLEAQGIQQEGRQLVDNGHFMALQCLQELEGQLQALEEAWALRLGRLEESWGLQKLRQELEQAEAWLASREGLLLNPNCGHSSCCPADTPGRREAAGCPGGEVCPTAEGGRGGEGCPTTEASLELKQQLLPEGRQNVASSATLDLAGAQCERPRDRHDRKHPFSLSSGGWEVQDQGAGRLGV